MVLLKRVESPEHPLRTGVYADFLFYTSEAVLAIFLILWLLGRWGVPLRAPCPPMKGDTMNAFFTSKVILDEGWWMHTQRLSAPHGLRLEAFPANGNLDFLVMRIAAFFVKEPTEVTNLSWFVTIVLTALISTWALIRLGISKFTAYVIGLLYAFLPHLYFRTTAHLMLVFYLVPIVITFCILVLSGKFQELKKHNKVLLFLGCFLVGFNYIYNAAFSLFFLTFTAAACLFLPDKKKKLTLAFIAIFLLIASTFLNLLPTILEYQADPGTGEKMTSFKSINSADIYALRIRNLVIPVRDHFIPLLAGIHNKVSQSNFPFQNEASLSNLGTIATIGFLFLLMYSLVKILNLRNLKFFNIKISSAAALTIAALLLASYGSFGSLINIISPQIRAYNRISVFIAFLSLFAFAFLLDLLTERFFKFHHGWVFILVLLGCLLVFGVMDQRPGNFKPVSKNAMTDLDSPKELVAELENKLPKGAMVFNLPYNRFPRSLSIHQMPKQVEVIPYLHSKHLRWSCMPLSQKAEVWQEWITNLPVEEMAAALCVTKFSGIWIDCRAYKDRGKKIIDKLSAIADDKKIYSRDQRYCFVFLEQAAKKFNNELSNKQKLFFVIKVHKNYLYRWNHKIDFSKKTDNLCYLVSGWHQQAPHGRWTSEMAVLKFHLFPAKPKSDVEFTLVAIPISTYGKYGSQYLEILVNDKFLQKFNLNPGRQTIQVTIPRADFLDSPEFTITLKVPNAASPITRGNNAPEKLGIFINSITLKPIH